MRLRECIKWQGINCKGEREKRRKKKLIDKKRERKRKKVSGRKMSQSALSMPIRGSYYALCVYD